MIPTRISVSLGGVLRGFLLRRSRLPPGSAMRRNSILIRFLDTRHDGGPKTGLCHSRRAHWARDQGTLRPSCQGGTQVILNGDGLGLQKLAVGQQHPQLLTA
jgi:hypothetical protein